MERWELQAPRELSLRPLPDPTPGDDEVLVDITCTTVSPGTELHAYRLGPSAMMTAPGYLAVGIVRSRGAAVSTVEPGQRIVLSAPHGSVAVAAAASVTPIPNEVDDEAASLAHLFGLGHGCLHAGDYRAGDDVAARRSFRAGRTGSRARSSVIDHRVRWYPSRISVTSPDRATATRVRRDE